MLDWIELLRLLATGDFRGGLFGWLEDSHQVAILLAAHDLLVAMFGTW